MTQRSVLALTVLALLLTASSSVSAEANGLALEVGTGVSSRKLLNLKDIIFFSKKQVKYYAPPPPKKIVIVEKKVEVPIVIGKKSDYGYGHEDHYGR